MHFQKCFNTDLAGTGVGVAKFALLLAASVGVHQSHAATVTVNATDDIYQAISASGLPGTAPEQLDVSGLSSVTFTVSSGNTVSLNIGTGSNYNDADGVGAAVSSSYNSGANGISGITAPNAGFLTGVFVSSTPSSVAPASLDFTSIGTNFTQLSPELQQTFFIGDGLTGDGTGTTQTFIVPTGASTLYLGISDACGYNGSPSCYGDNQGSFTVTVNGVPTVPEPSSYALVLASLGLLGWRQRRNMTSMH